jgi:predicted ester cyclase
MPLDENRAALATAIGRFNQPDLDAYMEIYDPDVALHGYPPGLPPGVAGARAFYDTVFAAFSPMRLEIHETVGEGELLAARYSNHGVHTGEFMGVPATGREIVLEGQTIMRFAGGRIVERWQAADMFGLMQQLGAIPG